ETAPPEPPAMLSEPTTPSPPAASPLGMTVQMTGRAEALGGGLQVTAAPVRSALITPLPRPQTLPTAAPDPLDAMGKAATMAIMHTPAPSPNASAPTVDASAVDVAAIGEPQEVSRSASSSASSLTDSVPLAARLTQAGAMMGSPPYMAPEQWLDAW